MLNKLFHGCFGRNEDGRGRGTSAQRNGENQTNYRSGDPPQRLASRSQGGPGRSAASDRAPPEAQRFRSMLLEAPCLISAIALDDGELLFQNDLSIAFCAKDGPYLDVLFSLQPESMKQDMLHTVRTGGTWKQVIQVSVMTRLEDDTFPGVSLATTAAAASSSSAVSTVTSSASHLAARSATAEAPHRLMGDCPQSSLLDELGFVRLYGGSLAGNVDAASPPFQFGGARSSTASTQYRQSLTSPTELGRAASPPPARLTMGVIQSMMRSLPGTPPPSEGQVSHASASAGGAPPAHGSSLGSFAIMDAMAEMVTRRQSISRRSLELRCSSMSGHRNDVGDAFPTSYKSLGTPSRLNSIWARAETEGRNSNDSRLHSDPAAGLGSAGRMSSVVACMGKTTGSGVGTPHADAPLPLQSRSSPLSKTKAGCPNGSVAEVGGSGPSSDPTTAATEDASVHFPLLLLTHLRGSKDSSATGTPADVDCAEVLQLRSGSHDPRVTMQQLMMMVTEPGEPKRAPQIRQHMGPERREEGEEEEEGAAVAWHEVTAKPFLDPVTGRCAVLLMQNEVTSRIEAENVLTEMSEGQLSMLSGIFPRHVIEFISLYSLMSAGPGCCGSGPGPSSAADTFTPELMGQLARTHDDVTILFMDIVGFTEMSKQVEPRQVMTFLNKLFTVFDKMVDTFGVQKVETAGDCYIAACGILTREEGGGFSVVGEQHDAGDSACRVMAFAKAMLAASKQVMMPHDGRPVQIRIGMHTGPCVTGLVGFKLPKFSIFGDTMNTASRMESTCTPGFIQASETTWSLLRDIEKWRPTGGVDVKGKGLMSTFIWDGETPSGGIGWVDGEAHSSSSNVDDGIPLTLPPLPAKEVQMHGTDAAAAAAAAAITTESCVLPSMALRTQAGGINIMQAALLEFCAPTGPPGDFSAPLPSPGDAILIRESPLPLPSGISDGICICIGGPASLPPAGERPLPEGTGALAGHGTASGTPCKVLQPSGRPPSSSLLAAAAPAAATKAGAFDPGLQLMCQHMLAWQGLKKLQTGEAAGQLQKGEAAGQLLSPAAGCANSGGLPLEESEKGQQSWLTMALGRHRVMVRSHSAFLLSATAAAGSAGRPLSEAPRGSGGFD